MIMEEYICFNCEKEIEIENISAGSRDGYICKDCVADNIDRIYEQHRDKMFEQEVKND